MAICNAWPKYGKFTCGAKCVKYITNEPNMFLMRKHEKLQSLVLLRVQTSEKMSKRHFIKHLTCTLWTTQFVHVLFATRGQHPKQIINRNKSYTKKIWQKLRLCLVTVFPLFSVFKNNFLFLRLKNLFGNPKWTENKNCFQNSICEENWKHAKCCFQFLVFKSQ